MAEYHYRKAAEIHPNNAVLLGCVGMVRRRLRMCLTLCGTDYDGSLGCREARG
jgi:hypothetical protein